MLSELTNYSLYFALHWFPIQLPVVINLNGLLGVFSVEKEYFGLS